ncbi:MAG TPA: riboflavin synthase, partial [Terricaulis sp.]|nr:riboflavin synthase [Terricaulis sp.]
MFTGIVTAQGGVEAVERTNGLVRLTIAAPYDADGIEIGASIAHEGVCLTVVDKGLGWFAVDV